ncbi:MAG: S8 family serine peptidase [Clostridia bacterium]|nr:S8 family serine peptidase [Clostridia bacterium]
MTTKLISLLLALTTALSGFCSNAAGALRSFGLQIGLYTDESGAFLTELDDKEVSQFDDNTGYLKNTLLVFFDETANLFDRVSILGKANAVAVGSLRAARLYVLRTAGCNYEQLAQKAEQLTALPGVALASVCPARRIEPQATPNDPFAADSSLYRVDWTERYPSGNNWNMEAIDARRAWGYDAYYNEINVGIVDAGFQTDHPDLEGLISFPSARLARRNNADDHGDHVAGIIAAKGNNGVGVCGLCQHCELTCVDWSKEEGQSWLNDVAIFFGFGHAVKGGAKVINFSVGATGSIKSEEYEYPKIYIALDAMLYSCYMSALLFNGYDFICVQSAGNGNEDGYAVDALQNTLFCSITKNNAFTPFFGVSAQSLMDRIIIVGSARLESGAYYQASSSNVGDQVNICAPGVNIFSCITEDGYGYMSGTSMAAPHVTAIAAMVWSVNPKLTAGEVKKIVCSSTKDTVQIAKTRYFEDLNYKEYPMVNAALSVETALKTIGGVSVTLPFTADPDSTVVLTDEQGRTFEFEADKQGKVSVVLLPGAYTAAYSVLRLPHGADFSVENS